MQFDNESLGKIYSVIVEAQEAKQPIEQSIKSLPKPWQDRLDALVHETLRRHETLETAAVNEEIVDVLQRLQERNRESRVATNAQAIAQAFSTGDKDKARQLLKSLERDIVIE